MMTAILNIIYYFFLFIDCVVYWLISIAYRVFLLVSQASFYNSGNDKIEALSNRIYVILGVAMLFILAYNIILLIMNPDKFGSNGDKSIQGLLKNLVISVVIITFLPTIFSWMNVLQNNILENQVIERVILGYTADNGDESAIIDTKNMGNKISTLIFSTFYHPVDDNGNVITYSDCKSPNLATDAKKICDKYVSIYENAESSGSFFGFMDRALMNELTTGLTNSVANMQYIVLASSVIGVVCLFMFVSYAIDIGIRVAKLTFLQIIAPVPVILRITKPSGGIFSKWLNMIIETYTSLFMRLITIYFSVFTVNLIADGFMSASGGLFGQSKETNGLIILFGYLFVIVGVLLFAKEAPELIKTFTGGKGGGGFLWKDIKKKFTDAGNVASSIPLVGKPLNKGFGAATGTLGALSTALQNRGSGIGVKKALKQGLANGWRNGGLQYGSQRRKAFEDRFGYGKKQGFFGGLSYDQRLKDKYSDLLKNNMRESVEDVNNRYFQSQFGDQIPQDKDELLSTVDNMRRSNLDFRNNSDIYKKAVSQVETEITSSGKRLSDSERKLKINEKLKELSQNASDNDRRLVNTYLKRDEIISGYDSTIGSPEFMNNLKLNSEAQAREYYNKLSNDPSYKQTIDKHVDSVMSEINGDYSKYIPDSKIKEIKDSVAKQMQNLITNNNGNLASVKLSADLQQKINVELDGRINTEIKAGRIQADDSAAIDNFKNQNIETITRSVVEEHLLETSMNSEARKQISSDFVENDIKEYSKALEKQGTENATKSSKGKIVEFYEGCIEGDYTREKDGSCDTASSDGYVENKEYLNKGVKTKSSEDEVWEKFKKWHDEQNK